MPHRQAPQPTVVAPFDLPLHCSGPNHETWNGHPRVFLPITANGSIGCPYCGSVYRLDGKTGGHH